ncbi:MAG TPA: glycosyltransferase [Rhizomicrobium sp.]|nr:glycosyltransferase [Rhizomicrobium sp.]
MSVIVPTYKSSAFLRDCLSSLRDQQFRDFEAIVVDDGSPESDAAIATDFAKTDERFTLIAHHSNMGVSAARNTGIDAARGEFFLFLDADDKLLPAALETQYGIATCYETDIVRTAGRFLTNKAPREFQPVPRFVPRTSPQKSECLQTTSQLGSLMIRREVLSSGKIRFDPELILGEDLEFISRALLASRSASLASHVTFLYRTGHESAFRRRVYTAEQWRSFGEFHRKRSANISENSALRALFGLNGIGHVAVQLAKLRIQLEIPEVREVCLAVMESYRGLDPALCRDLTRQPLDTPLETELFLRPLFIALAEQRLDDVVRCIDKLLVGPFREELLEAKDLRLNDCFEEADELVISAYKSQPWQPELALAYGKVLLHRDDPNALQVLTYAQARSVAVIESTLVLIHALRRWGHFERMAWVNKFGRLRLPHSLHLLDASAETYGLLGDPDGKLAALQQALEMAPRDPLRQQALIEALAKALRTEEALRLIAVNSERNGEEWRERLLAIVEWKTGDVAEAAQRIGALTEATHGYDLEAISTQADILLAIGDRSGALPSLATAAYHEGDATTYRRKYARVAREHGQFNTAFALLSDILETERRAPPSGELLRAMFLLLHERPELGDVTTFVNDNARRIATLPSLVAFIFETAHKSGDSSLNEMVKGLLALSLTLDPTAVPLLRSKALLSLSAGDTETALNVAVSLVDLQPTNPQTQALLAGCLAAKGRYLDAAKAYLSVFSLAADKGTRTAREQGQRAEISAILSEVVRSGHTASAPPSELLRAIFQFLHERRELGEAAAFVSENAQRIASFPGLVAFVVETAIRAAEDVKLKQAAEELIARALPTEPHSAPLMRSKALQLLAAGNPEAALEVARPFSKLFPRNPQLQGLLGGCLAANRLYAEASAAYVACFSLAADRLAKQLHSPAPEKLSAPDQKDRSTHHDDDGKVQEMV